MRNPLLNLMATIAIAESRATVSRVPFDVWRISNVSTMIQVTPKEHIHRSKRSPAAIKRRNQKRHHTH